MFTGLAPHIQQTMVSDAHEAMRKALEWVENGLAVFPPTFFDHEGDRARGGLGLGRVSGNTRASHTPAAIIAMCE